MIRSSLIFHQLLRVSLSFIDQNGVCLSLAFDVTFHQIHSRLHAGTLVRLVMKRTESLCVFLAFLGIFLPFFCSWWSACFAHIVVLALTWLDVVDGVMNSVAYVVELCEGLYISHDMILTGNRNSKNAETEFSGKCKFYGSNLSVSDNGKAMPPNEKLRMYLIG